MTHTLAIATLILMVGQGEPDAAPGGEVAFGELSADQRLAFVKKEGG